METERLFMEDQIKTIIHETLKSLFEHAKFNGGTEVGTEGILSKHKPAHFHWKNVHFRFQRSIPHFNSRIKEYDFVRFRKE